MGRVFVCECDAKLFIAGQAAAQAAVLSVLDVVRCFSRPNLDFRSQDHAGTRTAVESLLLLCFVFLVVVVAVGWKRFSSLILIPVTYFTVTIHGDLF